MKSQRLLIGLTFVNLGLFLLPLVRVRQAEAQSAAPVLRGRALEIVDAQGKVRASIAVLPPVRSDAVVKGKLYPETVILRLIDPNGRPSVKLATSVEGAGLYLGGDSDPTGIILHSEGTQASLTLINKDGRQQVIKP